MTAPTGLQRIAGATRRLDAAGVPGPHADAMALMAHAFDRLPRYALYAEDGVVKVIQVEDSPGQCTISGGEALLEAI